MGPDYLTRTKTLCPVDGCVWTHLGTEHEGTILLADHLAGFHAVPVDDDEPKRECQCPQGLNDSHDCELVQWAIASGPRGHGAVDHDPVNHPGHYTAHPSGIECIQVTEHMCFNLGNAVKYIWRSDLKGDAIEDLEKAAWYLRREIDRRKAEARR